MNNICLSWKRSIDSTNTIFTKGPFDIDGTEYDYMMEVDDGSGADAIDYCDEEQLLAWTNNGADLKEV